MSTTSPKFSAIAGIGLVVANMVGAGVFLSTGFMAQSMRPGEILVAWIVGLILALCGALAYSEIARLVPASGGEYRYLSTLIDPTVGNIAGWGSLLLGFSAPIALNAVAAGAFLQALLPSVNPRLVAVAMILMLTASHAVGWKSSARGQHILVAMKAALVLGFIVVAAVLGTWTWPSWSPPQPALQPAMEFGLSLGFIAFAFSGWNAAAYASLEFKSPKRDVPIAMVVGCFVVGAAYLVMNYLFIANLTPSLGSVVFNYTAFANLQGQYDAVTLGQAIMEKLAGPWAARWMGAAMVLIFASAISGMMLVGSRVYAAMAGSGDLPRMFRMEPGVTPRPALFLQAGIALLLVATYDLRTVLANVGALIYLFAGLTVLGLFFAAASSKRGGAISPPRPWALAAAAIYGASAVWTLVATSRVSPSLWLWIGVTIGVGVLVRTLLRRAAARRARAP